MLLREKDREIGYNGFPRTCRRGYKHIIALFQSLIGFGLEGIKFERQRSFELRRNTGVVTLALLECSITLGRRRLFVIRAMVMMSTHVVFTRPFR